MLATASRSLGAVSGLLAYPGCLSGIRLHQVAGCEKQQQARYLSAEEFRGSSEAQFAAELQRRIRQAQMQAQAAQTPAPASAMGLPCNGRNSLVVRSGTELTTHTPKSVAAAAGQTHHRSSPGTRPPDNFLGASAGLVALVSAVLATGAVAWTLSAFSPLGPAMPPTATRPGARDQGGGLERDVSPAKMSTMAARSNQEWLQALQAVLVQRALDAAERPNMHPETVKACLQQLEERASLLHAELAALQALHLTRDRDARMQEVRDDLSHVQMAQQALRTILEA